MHIKSDERQSINIFGAGGHGRVVADAAMEAGWCVQGFLDDRGARLHPTILNLPILGGRDRIPELVREQQAVVVAVGNNVLRNRLQENFEALGLRIATVISPHASVSKWATIGPGSVVLPGAVVNAGAVIGRGAIINTGAIIEHDCVVGDFVHLGPKCALGGAVRIGDLSLVGISASILPMIEVGARTVLGAGAVATRDLPDGVVAFGVPAHIQHALPLSELDVFEAFNKN